MDIAIKTIFQATAEPSFFESIVTRPSGNLLVTRQDTNELWEIDPFSGAGHCVLTLTEVDSLTGIVEITPDVYCLGGGTYKVASHEGPVPGSFGIWLIDLTSTRMSVRQVAKIPDIGQLNGIEKWNDSTILVADSYYGKVYRVHISDGSYSVCVDDDSVKDPPNTPVRMGVNGIKIRHEMGKTYLYYSNTTRMIFCRVPLGKDACPMGPPEVLSVGYTPESMKSKHPAFAALPHATIPSSVANYNSLPTPTEGFMPDDFCFDDDGSIYMTTHPTNMVMKVLPNGGGTVKIAGGFTSWEVASATACTFGRTEKDRHVLYVTTAGANVIPIEGKSEPAKIVAIDTKAL